MVPSIRRPCRERRHRRSTLAVQEPATAGVHHRYYNLCGACEPALIPWKGLLNQQVGTRIPQSITRATSWHFSRLGERVLGSKWSWDSSGVSSKWYHPLLRSLFCWSYPQHRHLMTPARPNWTNLLSYQSTLPAQTIPARSARTTICFF